MYGGIGIAAGTSSVRDCEIKNMQTWGVELITSSIEDSHVSGATGYGIYVDGSRSTIRNNVLESNTIDVFVQTSGSAAVIIDNVIHCPTSITSAPGVAYYAPTNGVEHSNQPRFAAGFC